MGSEKILSTYKNALALRESMNISFSSEDNIAGKYTSYPTFLRKFQEIKNLLDSHIDLEIVDFFEINKIPNPFDQTWPQQKQIFDMVFSNLCLLLSRLEIELDLKSDQIKTLKYFFEASTRRAIHSSPTNEREIQDIVETLLIGKGYEKGIDYDREVGRVKEVVPDFILLKLDLAIEIKLSKNKIKSKAIVDEINADIQSYSKRYRNLLFIVYDIGNIRDTEEFKNGIESEENGIYIVIIKH